MALNSRPEFRDLTLQARDAEVELANARNQLLPGLSAGMEASKDIGAAASSKGDKTPFELEAGVFFDLPVQRRKARGKILATEAKLAQITAKRELVENKVRAEREILRSNYGWFSPNLSADSLHRVRKILARHPEIEAAYIVRKPFPPGEPPLHVLGIVRKAKLFRFESGDEDRELVQKVASALRIPEEVLVLPLNRANKTFRKAFKKVPASKVS